ncbi:hypothetical protein RRF57_003496 [Xylaria bambusicola]|uniref:Ribosomal protein L19 n=1 Tax=Xylaria bambusicola TaxID=326684 RepID=A0AAN7UKB2_9PEZI
MILKLDQDWTFVPFLWGVDVKLRCCRPASLRIAASNAPLPAQTALSTDFLDIIRPVDVTAPLVSALLCRAESDAMSLLRQFEAPRSVPSSTKLGEPVSTPRPCDCWVYSVRNNISPPYQFKALSVNSNGSNDSFLTTAPCNVVDCSVDTTTTRTMLTQTAARRPLGAWKGALRRARQQRPISIPFSRTMATETTPATSSAAEPPPPPPPAPEATPEATPEARPFPKAFLYRIKDKSPTAPIRSAFAIYPQVPSARKLVPAPLESYHAQQIRRLDPNGLRTRLFSKQNRDSVKPGDVLQVTTKRGEPFAGVCLSIRRAGVDTAILLRNHLTKIGVEMWYKIYSPNIVGIEIVWRRPKRARRARLTYMRQPKHDMGNIDHLVTEWRRARNVFSSKGRGKQAGGATKGRR